MARASRRSRVTGEPFVGRTLRPLSRKRLTTGRLEGFTWGRITSESPIRKPEAPFCAELEHKEKRRRMAECPFCSETDCVVYLFFFIAAALRIIAAHFVASVSDPNPKTAEYFRPTTWATRKSTLIPVSAMA